MSFLFFEIFLKQGMSDSNGRICVPKTHALTTWRIPDTWQNHILSSAFTYWLLAFTQNFQPPHCPTLFFSNTRRLLMKEKTDEKPSSSIANSDFEVGGLSLFARVGGNAVSNRSFQCYTKLSAAKTDTAGLEPTTFWLTARRSAN